MINFTKGLVELVQDKACAKTQIAEYVKEHEEAIVKELFDVGYYQDSIDGPIHMEKSNTILESNQARLSRNRLQEYLFKTNPDIGLSIWVKHTYHRLYSHIESLSFGKLAEFKLLNNAIIEVEIECTVTPPYDKDNINTQEIYRMGLERLRNKDVTLISSEFFPDGYDIEDTPHNRNMLLEMVSTLNPSEVHFFGRFFDGIYRIDKMQMYIVPTNVRDLDTLNYDDFALSVTEKLNESEYKRTNQAADDLMLAVSCFPPENTTRQGIIEMMIYSISKIVNYHGEIYNIVEKRVAESRRQNSEAQDFESEIAARFDVNRTGEIMERLTRNLNREMIEQCGFRVSDVYFVGNYCGSATASLKFAGSDRDVILMKYMFKKVNQNVPNRRQSWDRNWDLTYALRDNSETYLINSDRNLNRIKDVMHGFNIQIESINVRQVDDKFIISQIDITIPELSSFLQY